MYFYNNHICYSGRIDLMHQVWWCLGVFLPSGLYINVTLTISNSNVESEAPVYSNFALSDSELNASTDHTVTATFRVTVNLEWVIDISITTVISTLVIGLSMQITFERVLEMIKMELINVFYNNHICYSDVSI